MNEVHPSEAREWLTAGRQALVSGSLASALSTAALAALAKYETDHAAAATNATSHWLWGDEAYSADEPSLRYTGLGYVTHHASAVFWATFLERWLNYRQTIEPREIVRDAAVMTGIAAAIDYGITPKRLRPGFEERLSLGALVGAYLAFGVGLAAGALLNRQHERRLERIRRMPPDAPAETTLH